MPDPPPVQLRAGPIVSALNRHGVEYVLIGGFAAVLHGSAGFTIDIDITPRRDSRNLRRLAAALRELDAQLRASGVPEPLDIPLAEETFDQFPSVLTLRTAYGDLDITFRPAAPPGETFDFERLAERAIVIEFPEPVLVADLDDVIASKKAVSRDKDLQALPLLYELRDQIRERGA